MFTTKHCSYFRRRLTIRSKSPIKSYNHLPSNHSNKLSSSSYPPKAVRSPTRQELNTPSTTFMLKNSPNYHHTYETTWIFELPSAYSWPDVTTIPSQLQIGYDLTGLNSRPEATQLQPNSGPDDDFRGTYGTTIHTEYKYQAGRGFAGTDGYLAEALTQLEI